MIKGLLQIAVVVLIFNAGFQAAKSYYNFYDLKELVSEQAHHGHLNTLSELHEKVLDLGAERGLDIKWEDVTVQRTGNDTTVSFAYVDNVFFIPRAYSKPWSWGATIKAQRPGTQLKDDEPH